MRRLLLAGLVLASVLVVWQESASAATPEAQFWTWFGAHAAQVAKISKGDEPIADQLSDELHKIDAHLTFELGSGMTPRELIISADGIVAAFPAVQRLVAAAPKLPGWKVIAFRPRAEGSEISFNGVELKAAELSFRLLKPAQRGKRLDVAIFVTGHKLDDTTKGAVYLLLDATLGEYDVETRLGGIDMRDGAQAPADARPFTELAAVVDANR